MSGSLITNAGLRQTSVYIDDTLIKSPLRLEVKRSLAQSGFQGMNGRNTLQATYRGAGLPDRPDTFEWGLEYMFSDDHAAELSFFEDLLVTPGPHTFAYWKQYRFKYTFAAGQSVGYLPRPDAFSKGYVGKTTQATWGAVITKNDVAFATAKIVYKAGVVSGDAVTADEVWISKAASTHPDSGASVALFKFGTAMAAESIITVDYYPLFNCDVMELATKPFELVDREDKSLMLVEVN